MNVTVRQCKLFAALCSLVCGVIAIFVGWEHVTPFAVQGLLIGLGVMLIVDAIFLVYP